MFTTKTQRAQRATKELREENPLSNAVIGCAIDVHRALGPGLLESVYEECLTIEFAAKGIPFERQKAVPITYRDRRLQTCLRLDLLVSDLVIVEVKAIEALLPIHEAQLLTYLRLSGRRLGLLINFNVPAVKDGIQRIAL